MSAKLLRVLDSFKARLSRRIVFWVFTSIVTIEAIILVPSYFRREAELFRQIEKVSEVILKATVRWKHKGETDRVVLDKIAILMNVDPNVRGISIYKYNGELIESLGEAPQINVSDLKDSKINKICGTFRHGDRYEIAWSARPLGVEYILIIRHDISSVKHDLHAFVLRISGLVLIISIFVTGTTMIFLGAIVIVPILRLRDDLMVAGEAIGNDKDLPSFYSLSVQRNDELGDVMAAFNQMFQRIYSEYAKRTQAEATLRAEREKSEHLLLNILPEPIAKRLKEKQGCIADGFAEVTILFADIVGFTQLSAQISPTELVNMLNEIFSAFDCLTEKYKLEKIKTIGDAYMVASGLPEIRSDHAEAIAAMALDMQQEIAQFNQRHNSQLNIRIGINSGEVVAGVIGTKKFIYDLWGDAVNTASRMESHGEAGRIQVSAATYKYLQDKYIVEERGIIQVKGKGEMMTYFLIGIREY